MIRWQARHGRHNLPWQGSGDPYRVWLSEIMLQQTRVATVIGYYERFLRRFPDLPALARAPLEDVLALWAGLGYYARARLAHACARAVMQEHAGRFPTNASALELLPGIGTSTAAAIGAICFGERAAVLDANVKRVLIRRYAIEGDPRAAQVLTQLWSHARALLPQTRQMARYTQAIMDLGAEVCSRSAPRCGNCPVREDCLAHIQGRVADLPRRAPSPARPVRRVQFLIALHRDAVLLEQRPPSGIWGGLLSPPQYSTRAALRAAAQQLGASSAPQALAPRRHGFTHFTLAFTAHLLHLDGVRVRRTEPRLRWLALAKVDEAPLPAPVLRLLRELRGSQRI